MWHVSSAQSVQECATPLMPPGNLCDPYLHQANDDGPFYVRIKVRTVTKTDGSDGLTNAEVEQALRLLDEAFNPHNIYFVWDGIDDPLKDTEKWESHGHIDQIPYVEPGYIVLLLGPPHPGTSASNGKALGVPGTALSVQGSYFDFPHTTASLSSILPHEVGHCRGLYHVHGQSDWPNGNNGPECIDGSTSETAGDCICDTPAWVNSTINNSYITYPTCQLNEVLEEETSGCPSGYYYNPDVGNLMSLFHPDCRKHFTLEQGKRMRNVLGTPDEIIPTLNLNVDRLYDLKECIVPAEVIERR